ncbi:hypothetical protein [Nocardioides alcanivorans]|uniref:hypothetical protein n=1 Tax=Nocardioides alcanivorans TaxID=2897352 RepID=UPI0024B0A25B|nr:hypothetical protein [Nocardioides alcanivorans]
MFVGLAEVDVAALLLGFDAGVVEVGVGFDDLGGGDVEDPSGAFAVQDGGDGGVDQTDCCVGEVAGEAGDLADHPHVHDGVLGFGPDRRESVA